jgi:hypothetical protein
LAELTKKERIALWRGRIRYAKEKSDAFYKGSGVEGEINWCPGVDFAIAAYRGEDRPQWWSPQDCYIRVNKVKAAIRAALPSLLYKDPAFQVYPAANDVENGVDVAYERSKAKAAWLNHWWRESHGTQHARVGIQNAFFSIGVAKAGYRCDFDDDPKRGVFAKDENGEYILGPDGDPELEKGEYLTDEDGEIIRDQYGVPCLHPGKVCKEDWFVESVDCRNMLFDVESGSDFFQHRFVIETRILPLQAVKENPNYPAGARKRLTSTQSLRGKETQRKDVFVRSDADMEADQVTIEKDEERITLYEIYDFENNRFMVLPEGGLHDENDEFLRDGPMPPGMEHGPYRFLKFTEDVGTEWYPIPDAIDMALVNREFNLTRSFGMIHLSHTKTRYGESPNAFDGAAVNAEEEREKWRNGGDATLLKLSGPGAIFPLEKATLDGSFQMQTAAIALDFNEVAGMPGEMRNIADADSATQASILATGAEQRNNDRRDNQVQNWLNEIGRVLLMSGQANAELDTLVVEKVIEQEGVAPFKAVKLTPEELQGEFEVTIQAGSTQAKNDPRVLQQLATFLANIGQNPVLGLFKGLNRRILDGMGLDPVLADEVWDASMAFLESQQKPAQGSAEGPAGPAGQQLQQMLMGQPSAAGGAPTGASVN